MIRVEVYLCKHGDVANKRQIAHLTIVNNGDGDYQNGKYNAMAIYDNDGETLPVVDIKHARKDKVLWLLKRTLDELLNE